MMTERMRNSILLSTDLYQLTMGYAMFIAGKHEEPVTFNIFFRKAPCGNNWAVVSGISEVLKAVAEMGTFSKEEWKVILPEPEYDAYCEYLANMKFTGDILAMREGEIAFPNENIVTIEAPFLQAQLLETSCLSILNHQMGVATKASRITRATKHSVAEFGSRRAHGIWAAQYGGKAAYIGGFTSTSNVLTTAQFGIPCTGTHAHSFIEFFSNLDSVVADEKKAFDTYIKAFKPMKKPLILLIDTFDPIGGNCGIMNAIKAFNDNGIDDDYPLYGIRLDSGDLAYQSRRCRELLDKYGFREAKIFATNGLDEYSIQALERRGAQIDFYGVGDAVATCKDDPCFGGVFKVAAVNGVPRIKLSSDPIKIINPGETFTYRIVDKISGMYLADICGLNYDDDEDVRTMFASGEITIFDEKETYKQTTLGAGTYLVKCLQAPIVENGHPCSIPTVKEARTYYLDNLGKFDESYTALKDPHNYFVDLSLALYRLKYGTIKSIHEQVQPLPINTARKVEL